MISFIDISNHQGREGLTDLSPLLPQVDAVIVKATQGTDFIDGYCDRYIQQLIAVGKPWGFYHFAGNNDPVAEANYFYENTSNYFKHGIPILDWEDVYNSNGVKIFTQTVDWVNMFVRRIHELTGIWSWIYGNPWRFNQGGVEPNCMRWIAAYPSVAHPTFDQAETWKPPSADGVVGAWQFCSDGRLNGYDGDLDCDLFYGDESAWLKYAGVAQKPMEPIVPESPIWKVTESSEGKIVLEKV